MEVTAFPSGKKIDYNDLLWLIIGSFAIALLVTEYGGRSPLMPRLFTLGFYVEYFTTLAITLLLALGIRHCTCYLDVRFGWRERLGSRILLQIVFGIMVPVLATFFLAAIYFACYHVNIIDTNYHLYALPFVAALITIFNVSYLARYLYAEGSYYHKIRERQPFLNNIGEKGGDKKETFIVHTLTKSFPIPVDDIAYFFRNGGHVFLRKFDGEDFLLSQSLDAIERGLDNNYFFRVARQMIISREAVKSFAPLTFGKIGVTLNPIYKEQVSASKPLARNFRLWLRGS